MISEEGYEIMFMIVITLIRKADALFNMAKIFEEMTNHGTSYDVLDGCL